MIGNTGLRVRDSLGLYSGFWGDLVLRQQDGEIWGTYEVNNGTIVGNITSDGVFVGWWSEAPTRNPAYLNAGEVEFRWSRNGGTVIALDGRWIYGSAGSNPAWVENWDSVLVTDRAAPSELIERFDNPNDFKRHP